jgi:hypothetical protein
VTAFSEENARCVPVADFTLGDIPFFSAISDTNAYQRHMLPFKRDQIDTSTEPGEQTLSAYWVRDQDSWHRGSGINFYEPGSDPYSRYRFYRSVGVNVWNQGDLTLHHKLDNVADGTPTGNVGVCSAIRSSVDGVYVTASGKLWWYPDGGPIVDKGNGGLTAATDPVVAGSKVLYGHSAGIAAATVGSETPAALWTIAAGATVRPWWVKSRIIAARGASLYELTLAGGAIGAVLCTHPDSNWEWTAVTESPDAILVAGKSNGYSCIYSLSLVTSGSAGATPTLGPLVQVAEFPPGEEVYSLKCYLGTFLAIGTSRGVRIADVGTAGQVRYGPLTIETTKPVRALGARDSFVYAAIEKDIDNVSGAARINLAEEITSQVNGIGYTTLNTQRYAWAYDVMLAEGADPFDDPLDSKAPYDAVINSLAFIGNTTKVVLGAASLGVFVENTAKYVGTGYVRSGWIRFATAEQKLFPFAKLRVDIPDDPDDPKIDFYIHDQLDGDNFVATWHHSTEEALDVGLIDAAPVLQAAQSQVAVTLILSANTPQTVGPTVRHLQLKALPRPALQREIAIPVRLVDREESRNGTIFGYDGWAYARLAALEALQQSNVIVTVTDNTCGEEFIGVITDVRLSRDTPPSRTSMNFGGVLTVVVNKL